MKPLYKFAIVFVLFLFISIPLATPTYALSDAPTTAIAEWEMMWEEEKSYMKYGIMDVILGAALVLIALGMLFCFLFIKKSLIFKYSTINRYYCTFFVS